MVWFSPHHVQYSIHICTHHTANTTICAQGEKMIPQKNLRVLPMQYNCYLYTMYKFNHCLDTIIILQTHWVYLLSTNSPCTTKGVYWNFCHFFQRLKLGDPSILALKNWRTFYPFWYMVYGPAHTLKPRIMYCTCTLHHINPCILYLLANVSESSYSKVHIQYLSSYAIT